MAGDTGDSVTTREEGRYGDIARQLAARGMRQRRAEQAGMTFHTNGITVDLIIRGADMGDDVRIDKLTVQQAVQIFEVVERLRAS